MFGNTPVSSLTKSLGYTKSKTYNLKKIKEDINSKKSRFKKKGTNFGFEPNNSSQSQILLTRKTSDAVIEMGSTGTLPPIWVDIYEETQEKIKKIHDINKEAQKLYAKRIKIQFGDHGDIDSQIERKNAETTRLLRECEANLGKVSQLGTTSNESQSDAKIRKNIQKSLACQIQEAAAVLRHQQKGLLDKLKDVNSTNNSSDLSNPSEMDQEFQEIMLADDIARDRDEDINVLIDNINELNHLFKQMNQIVIEQGTIVDRIDYNIEQALDNTVKGKQELVKAKKAMESKCAQQTIKVLIILNIIFTILFFLKFTKK